MTAKLTVRMEKDLLSKVQDAAKRDKRSVNQQLIWYAMQHLENSLPREQNETNGGRGQESA